MFIASIVMIGTASLSEGFKKDLNLSLGTGLLTSSLVSTLFLYSEKQRARIEALKIREKFTHDLKVFTYVLVSYCDFDINFDGQKCFGDFIKQEHRWFHEYYKCMVAHNSSLANTNLRIKQIRSFLKNNSVMFQQYFDFDDKWKKANMSDNEKFLLNSFVVDWKNTMTFIDEKLYEKAILSFSWVLEWFSMFPDTFYELRSFRELKFSKKEDSLFFITEEFDKLEPAICNIYRFHEVRKENYKKNYSKKS